MNRQSSGGLGPRPDPSSRVQKAESAADKMAALKARVAAAIGSSKAKGGLKVGLHPALEDLGQWKPPARSAEAKPPAHHKHPDLAKLGVATGKSVGSPGAGPDRGESGSNPYFDESLASQPAGGRQRPGRELVFAEKGKYIAQANARRRQEALEAMKRRIAEQSRKAGIDEDLDVEKGWVVAPPPDIEWFDEWIVKSYDESTIPDDVITAYIQHPVQIEPPQDKNIPAPKPMYLTTKEQKKLRRQRRMAGLKERQAKERLGLIPAEPPKVKKANLMRVLGEEAVKDPTAVEARVNKEIAQRHQKHLDANDARRLTKEEKHEKLAANQDKDAAKGIHLLVFKIGSLANGQHRFKIGKNAEQMAITGICIMHPKFNLVIAEGGEHSIRQYKKLMLNRIDWTENAPSRQRDGRQGVTRDWLQAEDDKGGLKDMTLNECKLVFEGEEKTRSFKKWGSKVCENDAEAKETLSRYKMENFWSIAKGLA